MLGMSGDDEEHPANNSAGMIVSNGGTDEGESLTE